MKQFEKEISDILQITPSNNIGTYQGYFTDDRNRTNANFKAIKNNWKGNQLAGGLIFYPMQVIPF